MFSKKKLMCSLLFLVVMSQVLVFNVFAFEKFYYSVDVTKSDEEIVAVASPEDKIKAQSAVVDKNRLYLFLNKEENKQLDPIANAFNPTGKTDLEKLMSVVRYVESLGLTYSPETDYNLKNQVNNIQYGHTMCLGASILGGKLIDKTGMEYRYVLKLIKTRSNPVAEAEGGGHIILEVKTSEGKWMEFDPTEILCKSEDYDLMPSIRFDLNRTNARKESDIPERIFNRLIGDVGDNEYRNFVVSPVYKSGNMIDSNLRIYNEL